jgi:hypothetical protein
MSCTHEADAIGDIPEICFEGDILPIFLNNCAITSCHDLSSDNEYVFTTYEGILKAVERGRPLSSKAYKSLVDIWDDDMMPPGNPLSIENRTKIRLWIEQGANYTVCPEITSPENPDAYVNPRACFERDILPVVLSSCAVIECHDDITAEEDYSFTSYQNIMEIIRPGDPVNSKLYKVITLTDPNDIMPPPPNNKLLSAQIDSIFAWISYGATDEFCGEPCDTISTVTFNLTLGPIIENTCRGCHSGANPSGNTRLENYDDIAILVASGQLMGVLNATSPYLQMPPSGALSPCRIRQFELWIDDGFLNN